MTPEEKIAHANNLKDYPSWKVFVQDMMELKEMKASEMTSAYLNDRSHSGAFSAGFRLALETVIEYPERTIKKETRKKNAGIIDRLRETVGIGGNERGA